MKPDTKVFVGIFLLCGLHFPHAQTVMDVDASGLRTEFNNLKNYPRIVTIVDPLCSGCIAHASDLRNFLYSQCNNPDLRGMIVWVKTPGFPSTKSDAIDQASLWSDPRITHYWNTPIDDIPYTFANATGISCSYAWDISLMYEDSVEWLTCQSARSLLLHFQDKLLQRL